MSFSSPLVRLKRHLSVRESPNSREADVGLQSPWGLHQKLCNLKCDSESAVGFNFPITGEAVKEWRASWRQR